MIIAGEVEVILQTLNNATDLLKFIPAVKIHMYVFNIRLNTLTSNYDKSRLAVGTLSAVTPGDLYIGCR